MHLGGHQAVPLKNLGALHQHLMNVMQGDGFVPGGGHVGHMGQASRTMLRRSATLRVRADVGRGRTDVRADVGRGRW